MVKSTDRRFTDQERSYGFRKFVPLSELRDATSGFVVDDTLVISACVRVAAKAPAQATPTGKRPTCESETRVDKSAKKGKATPTKQSVKRQLLVEASRQAAAAAANGPNADSIVPAIVAVATHIRGETAENRQKINAAMSAFDKHVSCLSGLDGPKRDFREIMSLMLHHQLCLKPHGERVNYNLIIKGRPGTGKTTLVRALYEALAAAGVLEGNFVEVKPNELKLKSGFEEEVKKAAGGMVFIDEAYELETKRALNNDLNRAINEQGGLPLFVVAGYPDKIEKWLAHDNPKGNVGLRSRFAYDVTIPDYSADDLMKIFDMKLRSREMAVTPEARPLLVQMAHDIAENPQSNNGRDVKQIVDRVQQKWTVREGIADLNRDALCDAMIVQDGINAWRKSQPKRTASSASPPATTAPPPSSFALSTFASTAASVQPEAERVTIEEVRAALCDLCERADGCIVPLHDIGKRLRDEIIMKLGGIPAEVKCARSRSCDKKDFMASLATHLKGTFGVVVKHNTTGKKIADHPRFKGLYAMNLRMIE